MKYAGRNARAAWSWFLLVGAGYGWTQVAIDGPLQDWPIGPFVLACVAALLLFAALASAAVDGLIWWLGGRAKPTSDERPPEP